MCWKVLENLIRFEVLAKEADKRGLGEDPEVVRTMKQVMIQKLMQDEFDNRVKIEDITDAEMKAFYDSHNNEYNQPEQVRVSALVVKRDGKLAARLADEIKGPKGQDNKAFRDMVMQFSEDEASKVRGGDLRYFDETTQEVPKDVVKASFALEKVGDVAGPIKTDQGFYIIKQTGRRKALTRTFDEVKRQIQNRLYREKRTNVMEAFVENLRKTAKVQLFDERIAKIQVDMTGSLPGGDAMGSDPTAGLPSQAPALGSSGAGMMATPTATPDAPAPAAGTPAPAGSAHAVDPNEPPTGAHPIPPMGPRGTPPPIAPDHHPRLPDPRGMPGAKPAAPKHPDHEPAG